MLWFYLKDFYFFNNFLNFGFILIICGKEVFIDEKDI